MPITYFMKHILLLACLACIGCGATAGLTPRGAAFVQAGFVSKIGQADVLIKTPQGGSVEVHQSNYNGTEVANSLTVMIPLNTAAKGTAAAKVAKEGTAKVTAKGKADALVKGTKDPNLIPKDPNLIPKDPNLIP